MQTFASMMEMLMVLCFGISWPLNVLKAWRARTAKGTSLTFYFLIWIGYFFAIIGKLALIIYNSPSPWYVTVKWYVLIFYFLNAIMVTVAVIIYFRNCKLDKKRAEEAAIGRTAAGPADDDRPGFSRQA